MTTELPRLAPARVLIASVSLRLKSPPANDTGGNTVSAGDSKDDPYPDR
jgi:hypothetical protein